MPNRGDYPTEQEIEKPISNGGDPRFEYMHIATENHGYQHSGYQEKDCSIVGHSLQVESHKTEYAAD